MKKLIRVLTMCIFMVISIYGSELHAQRDSSYLHLGTLELKKIFTPHITIKGENLQKSPMKNIDHLEVYLSCKNLIATEKNPLLDQRKYYGMGFMIGL